MRENREEYVIKIDNLPCGFCKIRNDDILTIVSANDFFYQSYGYAPREAESAGFTAISNIIHPADWPKAKEKIDRCKKERLDYIEIEVKTLHSSGSVLWNLIKCTSDPEEDKCLNCIILDISKRMEAIEALKMGEKEKVLLLGHAKRFAFRFYPSTRTAVLSEDTAMELGLPVKVENLPESIADTYPAKESREEFITFYDRMLEGRPKGTAILHFRNKTGDYTWYECTFSMVYNREGLPLHAIVSFEDISEQREKEIAYEKWSQFNQSQQENAVAYYECDITKNILESVRTDSNNILPEAVVETYDKTLEYVVENLIVPEDRQGYVELFCRSEMIRQFHNGKREMKMECQRYAKDGTVYWVMASLQMLPDPYSDHIKAFILITDIDKEKRKALELHERSRRDPLTGVLNRRAIIDQVTEVLDKSQPNSRHIFIMVDIDHFKELNDNKGHQFGDWVLSVITSKLKESLRADDILGRLGGDEFIAFLKDVPDENVLQERLDSLLKKLAFSTGSAYNITGSLGIAVYPKDGKDFDGLYKKADLALYEAKRRGRNQYVFYKPGMIQ